MNRFAIGVIAAVILTAAAPGFAQSGGTPAQPGAGTIPPTVSPPAGTTPPGPGTTTPPAATPAVPAPAAPVETLPVVNQPVQQAPPPPAPITIPPDANYPNGFQDPVAPFENSVRADNDREAGFPWGLLGLLGLLGLIPLVRGHGHRTAAIEREVRRDRD
jgi:hypothetical protein